MQQQIMLDPSTVVEVRQEINRLLENLTPESLLTMRQFAAFLQTQQAPGQSNLSSGKKNRSITANSSPKGIATNPHEWRTVSATDVMKLTTVLANGYDGDSLDDTEAMYDE